MGFNMIKPLWLENKTITDHIPTQSKDKSVFVVCAKVILHRHKIQISTTYCKLDWQCPRLLHSSIIFLWLPPSWSQHYRYMMLLTWDLEETHSHYHLLGLSVYHKYLKIRNARSRGSVIYMCTQFSKSVRK